MLHGLIIIKNNSQENFRKSRVDITKDSYEKLGEYLKLILTSSGKKYKNVLMR
jgi:hypothetical protein